jgi:hypothetical protein
MAEVELPDFEAPPTWPSESGSWTPSTVPAPPPHPAVDTLRAAFGWEADTVPGLFLNEREAARILERLGDVKPGELAPKSEE